MDWYYVVWGTIFLVIVLWVVLALSVEPVTYETIASEVGEADDPEQYCCPECAAERFFEYNG